MSQIKPEGAAQNKTDKNVKEMLHEHIGSFLGKMHEGNSVSFDKTSNNFQGWGEGIYISLNEISTLSMGICALL